MSFFFMKAAGHDKGPVKVTDKPFMVGPRNAQAQQNTLHRLGCSACPLNSAPISSPKMQPTLVPGAAVYFLAEAPGRDEDENTGRPLTGPSGRLLRECVPPGNSASYDNVCNCRPEGNRTPTWQEAECCRPRRVKWIEEAKPKIIVGLGAVPLHFMLNSKDIAGMRGRCFAVKVGNHACWFLPTYHPSFILRTAYDKKKPLQSRLGHCFRMDIKKAFELAEELEPTEIETDANIREGISGHTFDGSDSQHFVDCLDLLDLASAAPIKAIDIETKGLRPYSEGAAIMSVAISFDGPIAQRLEQAAYNRQVGGSNPSGTTNFSFAWDHPKAKWTDKQKLKIGVALQRMLKDDTIKIAHNAPFEIEWFIWLFGKDVIRHDVWHDTQMQAHFIDERKGKHQDNDSTASKYQSLDFLVNQYFGISFKGLFKLNKKDMSQSDLGETLIYNAVDTKMTLKLFNTQTAILKKRGLWKAYLDSIQRQPTVALIQSLGVNVDQKEVKRAQNELGAEIESLTFQIEALKVVQAYKADHGSFNPQSVPETIALFRDYLKCKEIAVEEEHGTRYSVDKNVLDQIDHPLADLIVRLRNKSKMKATYIDGLELGVGNVIYPDGKLHTNFHTTFTETGRLSSSSPNMQNYPKRSDSWARKAIVPPKGHLFVAVDYGQLEGCTGAMCSKDKYLVEALWNDYDIHMVWAEKLASKIPDFLNGTDLKKFRSLVKNKLTFPAFFGAANTSVRDYLAAATGLDVDQDKIDDIMDEFWDTFKGMKKWQDATMHRYYEIGYVETLVGRRHHYPLTRNQAINMPVQGTAAELVCDAMNRLSKHAATTEAWHLHPILNVHDDLSFFIPDDDNILEDSLKVIIKEMLTFSYKWVNVPLSVEVSIGKNWADVQPIGKFWSNKEV